MPTHEIDPGEQAIDVALPPWPSPVSIASAVGSRAPRSRAAEHQAGVAAAVVAGLVALPALAAVGTVLAMFVVTLAVLVAPAIALALTWVAWRYHHARPRRPALRSA